MQITWSIFGDDGAPVTGGAANTSLKIRRGLDGYLLDWADMTFKAAGWGTLATTLAEIDATNLPGDYKKDITVTTWDDGYYQAILRYSSGGLVRNGAGEFYLRSGLEVEAVVAAVKGDSAAILLDTGTDGVVLPQAQADKVWSTAARALTDKAGFTISGTKQTLDALQDLSQAGAQAGAAAALTAYDPPTKAELDAAVSPLALEASTLAIKTKTDALPSDPADQSLIIAATDAIMTRLGLPVGASMSADILVIDNLVDDLEARLTALRAGYLDNLSAGAVALEANVQVHAAAALTAYDSPTKAEMDAALAALNDITVAEILAGIVEGTLDVAEVLRLILAAAAGKAAGGGTGTITFRDLADTKNRITATVDANYNRTAVTLDPS